MAGALQERLMGPMGPMGLQEPQSDGDVGHQDAGGKGVSRSEIGAAAIIIGAGPRID